MIEPVLQQANIALLEQLKSVIESLNDEQYTRVDARFYRSSVGAHTRHMIEHYQAFFCGAPKREIRYDDRQRDAAIEQQRGEAIVQIDQLIAQLAEHATDYASIDNKQITELTVFACVDPDESTPTAAIQSTLERELMFLHSHAVHHHAYIAFILRLLDVDVVPAQLGLAPATMQHQEQDRCAP